MAVSPPGSATVRRISGSLRANETTGWPEGVSVSNVPDMVNHRQRACGVPDCSGDNDGCSTFYYTNQQSARLMFYHDHAWGITRLNVYAGEAAGYLITDATEQKLIADGTIPADQIPLVIQDRTFVPGRPRNWRSSRTRPGTIPAGAAYGDFWYQHVYMPAQNPGRPVRYERLWTLDVWAVVLAAGTPPYGPIANPYYNPGRCNLNDPTTWTYRYRPLL